MLQFLNPRFGDTPTSSIWANKNPKPLKFSSATVLKECEEITTTPPMADLRTAWNHPQIRDWIECSIRHGNFKYSPGSAEAFIKTLDRVCQDPHYKTDQERYTALRKHFAELKKNSANMAPSFIEEQEERADRRIEQVEEMLKGFQPERCVDIGSGDGWITQRLTKMLKQKDQQARPVIGLDVTAATKRPKNQPLVLYDGNTLPFQQNSLDLMTLFAVLHHMDNPETLLKKLFNLLRPGGRLVIRDFDAPTDALKRFNIVMDDLWCQVYEPNPEVPVPGHFKSAQGWQNLLQKIGFKIAHFSPNPEPSNPYKPFLLTVEKPDKDV